MQLLLKGDFIDSDDAEQLLRGISRLLKSNVYSGTFRPNTPNCVMWFAFDDSMPLDEVREAYTTMNKMLMWAKNE